jgi:RNA polymerase sigma factor (sigma-70 family)
MGDVEFDRWYLVEHARVLTALTVVSGDPHLARDAVDEAFARAFERWSRVGGMDSPAGWTYRTALNVLRRRVRRADVEARLRFQSRPDPGAAPPSDWSSEVWEALRLLPLRERTAVALRYVADLSTAQIADAMRIAPGTVGSTLHSARQRMAATLGDLEGASVPLIDLEEVRDA